MIKVAELIDQVAETNTTVLIIGETGVGKELVAKSIHNRSIREKDLLKLLTVELCLTIL